MARAKRNPKYVMISVVAERYGIHPQTLRLYERQGLLKPVRSAGNTRLYDQSSLERLETILTLTRDLGVNLAGVEVVLNLQQQLREMQEELSRVMDELEQETRDRRAGIARHHALVKFVSGPPSKI